MTMKYRDRVKNFVKTVTAFVVIEFRWNTTQSS